MDSHDVIKKQSVPPLFLRLAVGMAAVFSLTSCQWLGIPDPFKEQRPDQVVEGPRHAPILNPQTVPPEPAISGYVHGTEPPQVQPIREGISPQYYENGSTPNGNVSGNSSASPAAMRQSGLPPSPETNSNEANPVAPEAGQSQNNQSQQSGLFGSDDDDNIRKRLPGNPPQAYDASAPGAPRVVNPSSYVSLAPSAGEADEDEPSSAQWPSQSPRDNHSVAVNSAGTVPTGDNGRADDDAADDAVTSAPESAPPKGVEPSQPSWLQRWFGKYSGNEQDPARNAPTPSLSSVPPTPAEFQAVKDDKLQDMQDLQGDHIEAQQEKQQLDSEPSQQPAAAPVNNAAPGDFSSGQPVNPAASPSAGSDQPVLLGHVGASADDSSAPADTAQGLKMPSSDVLPPPAESKPASPESDDYVSALQRKTQQSSSVMFAPATPPAAASAPASQAQPDSGDAGADGIGGYQVDPALQRQPAQ